MNRIIFWLLVTLMPMGAQPVPQVTKSEPLPIQCLYAIWTNDVERAAELIENGWDINRPLAEASFANLQTDGKTYPVQYAVKSKRVKILELFVSKGANLKIKNDQDETLLHLAQSDPGIISYLLSKGVPAKGSDHQGNTALHLAASAAYNSNTSALETIKLLKKIPGLKSIQNKQNQTAANIAFANGYSEALRLLDPHNVKKLEHKLATAEKNRPEELDLSKSTTCGLPGLIGSGDLLRIGMKEKKREIIKCAIEKQGAKLANIRVCLPAKKCESVSHVFQFQDDKKIVEYVIDISSKQLLDATSPAGNAMTALISSYRNETEDQWIKKLLDKGVSPNIPNGRGMTAHELACIEAPDSVVKRLNAESMNGPFRKGEKIWLFGSKRAVVTRVCKRGAVVDDGNDRWGYYAFNDLKRESNESYAKKKATPSNASPSTTPSICLAFDATGALTCRDMPGSSCPGSRFWAGPGPCSSYNNKTVRQLNKSQWGSLISAFNGEAEDRNKVDEPKGQSKEERCQKACRQKKCGSKMSGEYTASVSAGLRCAGFCDQECSMNPERYR